MSLEPPPYRKGTVPFELAQSGIHRRGDALLSECSFRTVAEGAASGELPLLQKERLPAWVDRRAVERGQRVFLRYYASFSVSLTQALLHGFVIARFSEVLVLSGYTRTYRANYERFRDTAHAVLEWFSFDLFDALSVARRSVARVRCAHELARRSAKLLSWPQDDETVGLPLSQYDMALVQMAFTGLVLQELEHQAGVQLSAQEKHDYIHAWRLLGHLLGIEDHYNIAQSVQRTATTFKQFMEIVPLLTADPRRSSVELVQSTIRSFSLYTPASYEYFSGLLWIATRHDELTADWTNVKRPSEAYQKRLAKRLWQPPKGAHTVVLNTMRFTRNWPRLWSVVETVLAWMPNWMKI